MAEASEDSQDDLDPRGDHFTTRRAVFLKHLARNSSVKKSAKKAKIPNSTLYLWREKDPDFAAAWLKALAAGYELLEMEMLDRARKGVKRTIYYHGKKVAKVRDYDNKMALQLLRLHRETVALVRAEQAAAQAEARAEPVRDTLDEKLKKVNERLRAYQAEKRRKQECIDSSAIGAKGVGDAR
ncbi:hypothetical protein AB1K62_11205 [Parasphingorhabdus sp. JC815]|uniref:hypothetical protein n=1 Tax=Parasphingorhabdus sp. JC815 TaxID=3232140 RepID=UPI00345822AF